MPTPPQVLASSAATIVPVVKAMIVAATGIDSSSVKVCRRKKIPPFGGGPDILLRLSSPRPLPEWFSGSGRYAHVIYRVLEVVPRVRLQVDMSDRDDTWLLDSTKGLIPLEDVIVNALQGQFPVDGNGNHLTIQGMILVEGERPEDNGPDPAWGQSTIPFGLFYEQPENTAVL
jgi:hypothetical protein